MGIRYLEKDGELEFFYEEEVLIPTRVHLQVCQVYESSGKIPKKIREKGDRAIKNYAERKVRADIGKQKAEVATRDRFAKNPNFPVSVEHDGKTLRGKIISAEDTTLRVRLEEPCQGESFVIYGFASAMAGKHIFDGAESFSKDAIASAQKLLIEIYEEKKHLWKHKEVIALAERLNNLNG